MERVAGVIGLSKRLVDHAGKKSCPLHLEAMLTIPPTGLHSQTLFDREVSRSARVPQLELRIDHSPVVSFIQDMR